MRERRSWTGLLLWRSTGMSRAARHDTFRREDGVWKLVLRYGDPNANLHLDSQLRDTFA